MDPRGLGSGHGARMGARDAGRAADSSSSQRSVTYAVINDGAGPGLGTGDGLIVWMRRSCNLSQPADPRPRAPHPPSRPSASVERGSMNRAAARSGCSRARDGTARPVRGRRGGDLLVQRVEAQPGALRPHAEAADREDGLGEELEAPGAWTRSAISRARSWWRVTRSCMPAAPISLSVAADRQARGGAELVERVVRVAFAVDAEPGCRCPSVRLHVRRGSSVSERARKPPSRTSCAAP